MTESSLPRIMVVDDEEAILETMTFTFMDVYDVLTSTDARKALDIMDENAPISVVITDQRMPEMTGSEFLKEVYDRWPETSRKAAQHCSMQRASSSNRNTASSRETPTTS